jgi:hypothetical protein
VGNKVNSSSGQPEKKSSGPIKPRNHTSYELSP